MQIRPATVPPVNGVCVCVPVCALASVCVRVCARLRVWVCVYAQAPVSVLVAPVVLEVSRALIYLSFLPLHVNTVQHTAAPCNTLQQTATVAHCNAFALMHLPFLLLHVKIDKQLSRDRFTE